MMYEDIAEVALGRIPPAKAKALPLRATLFDSLQRAKKALAARQMDAADARAWLDLDDLQERLLCDSACALTRVKG
jgi:hypothetical protein